MRDPKRIKRICDVLYSCWTQNRDFRFGQLISNINSYYNNDGDIFFPEDDQWEEWIGKYENDFDDVDKIKIGDTVEVIDSGKGYSTYFDWAKKYIPDGYYWLGDATEENEKYTVVCQGSHEHSDDMLYGICNESSKRVYIISGDGIKKG